MIRRCLLLTAAVVALGLAAGVASADTPTTTVAPGVTRYHACQRGIPKW